VILESCDGTVTGPPHLANLKNASSSTKQVRGAIFVYSMFIWYYSVCFVCKGFLFLFAFVRDTEPPSYWDYLSAGWTSHVLPTAPNSQRNLLKSDRYLKAHFLN